VKDKQLIENAKIGKKITFHNIHNLLYLLRAAHRTTPPFIPVVNAALFSRMWSIFAKVPERSKILRFGATGGGGLCKILETAVARRGDLKFEK
jgi:hypothetical protein